MIMSKFITNDCILIPYYSTELFLESMVVYHVFTNVLRGTGKITFGGVNGKFTHV